MVSQMDRTISSYRPHVFSNETANAWFNGMVRKAEGKDEIWNPNSISALGVCSKHLPLTGLIGLEDHTHLLRKMPWK